MLFSSYDETSIHRLLMNCITFKLLKVLQCILRIFLLLLLLLIIPHSDAHILGGSQIQVNQVIFQFLTDPAFVVEDEDFYLSFSVQDAVTEKGLKGIQATIIFYDNYGRMLDTIDVEGSEIIEGDFAIKYNFENDGIYDVKIEILKESDVAAIDTQFRILVANKSILEDSSFIVGIVITSIIIGLIIKNRVIDR